MATLKCHTYITNKIVMRDSQVEHGEPCIQGLPVTVGGLAFTADQKIGVIIFILIDVYDVV
jgi:uncharacterized protein (DUF433 family)